MNANLNVGNNIGSVIGATAGRTSTFLNGASECYGVVVTALIPILIWLMLVVMWRYVIGPCFGWEGSLCCCRVAAHDVAKENDSNDDELSEDDNDNDNIVERKSYLPSSATGNKKRLNEHSSQQNSTGVVTQTSVVKKIFAKWTRVMVSEHLYLSTIFPCNEHCSVVHPVELIAHVLVVITIYAALCVAFTAEYVAMRIMLGAIATFIANFVHVIADVMLSRWVGRGHDNRHWVSGYTRVVAEWAAVVLANNKGQGDADRVMTTIVEMLDLDLHDGNDIADIRFNGQQRLPQPPPAPAQVEPPHAASEQHLQSSSVGDIDVDEILWDDLPSTFGEQHPPPKPSGLGDYVSWLAAEAMAADDIYDDAGDVTTDTVATVDDTKHNQKSSLSTSSKRSKVLKKENSFFADYASSSGSSNSSDSSTLSWARPGTVEPSGAMVAFMSGGFDYDDEEEVKAPPPPPSVPRMPPTPSPIQRKRSMMEIRKDVVQQFAGRRAPPRTPTPPEPETPLEHIDDANELLRVIAAYHAWERRCRLLNLPRPWWSIDASVRFRYTMGRWIMVACWVATSFAVVHYGLQVRVGVEECTDRLTLELPIILLILDAILAQTACSIVLVVGWRRCQ